MLQVAQSLGLKRVKAYGTSELVVNQVSQWMQPQGKLTCDGDVGISCYSLPVVDICEVGTKGHIDRLILMHRCNVMQHHPLRLCSE